MAANTRCLVGSATLLVPLRTWETVVVETPASRATSLIVARILTCQTFAANVCYRLLVRPNSVKGRTWQAFGPARVWLGPVPTAQACGRASRRHDGAPPLGDSPQWDSGALNRGIALALRTEWLPFP